MSYLTTPEWQNYLALMEQRPSDFFQSDTLRLLTDPDTVEQFVRETGARPGVRYYSDYHILVADLVEEPSGRRFVYERVLNTREEPAVVTVPVCDGRFALLRQFRHAMREGQLAFPRGYGEKGISSGDNAEKEIGEELGSTVTARRFLGTAVADSGVLGARIAFWQCDITPPQLKRGYEEIEDLLLVTREELNAMIARGEITDALTLAALQMLDCTAQS